MRASFVLLALFASAVFADVYLHNPKGSNNRLNGANENTDTNNRLFDSQNNNAGGYNWGEPLAFYEGSELSIEWTSQHGCGIDNIDCQIIIQYACSSSDSMEDIRDGLVTERIPQDGNPASATYYDMVDPVGGYTYGMHEGYDFYMRCNTRSRNMGLFTADQNMNGRPDARFTRQDNNAARRGFECPEERDYYPYWASTIWRDVAIMTSHTSQLCPMYRRESQNVKSRWECLNGTQSDPLAATYYNNGYLTGQSGPVPLEMEQCPGTYIEIPSWGIDAPKCVKAPFSRDNHLGNGENGHANMYNWTIPSLSDAGCNSDSCVCVLRVRYNMSSNDFPGWDEVSHPDFPEKLDWRFNGDASPIKQDPMVQVANFNLTMTLNTDEYARTFEDRTHTFYIKQRGATQFSGPLYNLNVRGRRGNIVEVYPAVEYDFAPTYLDLPEYSFVHFQWTGSDSQPNNQAGNGRDQTDRNNIVQIKDLGRNFPLTEDQISNMASLDVLFQDIGDRQRFAASGQNVDACPSYEALAAANNNNDNQIEEDPTNCMYLNAASPYFDGGVFQFGLRLGKSYHYLSTRNNNFSNRSQKASITIQTAIPGYAVGVIAAGGTAAAGAAVVGASFYMSKVKPHSAFAGLWTKIARVFGK
jgi:hypothetical protein